ncbi:MAG: 30S ribosomal protein S20 [Phycisphaerae bacterium]|nr:30S ribosomal protein S20 [Phycisphaerae bacterium]
MAHSLSAKKRIRQNAKHRARNRARKDLIKNEVKGFAAAIASGDVKKATEALNQAASRIDRVAAKGTIHKNAAARKRSRLAKRLNVLKAGGGKHEHTTKRGAKV